MISVKSANESAQPTFNLAAALDRLGGDKQLLRTLAQVFVEDSPVLLTKLKAAYAKGDASRLRHAAHSIRGLAANFNAHTIVDLARQIEDQAAGSSEVQETAPANIDRLAELVAAMSQELPAAARYL